MPKLERVVKRQTNKEVDVADEVWMHISTTEDEVKEWSHALRMGKTVVDGSQSTIAVDEEAERDG